MFVLYAYKNTLSARSEFHSFFYPMDRLNDFPLTDPGHAKTGFHQLSLEVDFTAMNIVLLLLMNSVMYVYCRDIWKFNEHL